ncbi:unnamed protein product [Schistosoma turkestanicum]|nr:unnamed protein product [Schistosoma turkestanicum]
MFYIKPFAPQCSDIKCGPHQHCVENINKTLTCVCNVFYAPENLDPKVPLECHFSWITLIIVLAFSLLALICIIWIMYAICKAWSRRRKYETFQPSNHDPAETESIKSVGSRASIPYNTRSVNDM